MMDKARIRRPPGFIGHGGLVVLSAMLWAALGCAALADTRPRTIEVPGWVAVDVPPGFSVERSGDHLSIREEALVRSPLMIQIFRGRLHSMMFRPSERQTPLGPVGWQVTEHMTAGSGGPEWELRIDFRFGTVIARQQAEYGPPDFVRVWKIVDSIRAAPER